ncbi:hypothetical protein KIN20_030509 [Parelaphostrongylus tenuis]|uniref:Uncharacterized protein n=1 Tax=Parelaphostrongylus tenuis TaxID=148309 RepID=A0AAD5WGC7_PARTN|nr:hypothetical protein KIN20_030509 [Parelaphostrongylus tenuis]
MRTDRHFFQPFIPIETKLYTKEEISNMYQYYYDKRWPVSEKGISSPSEIVTSNSYVRFGSIARPHQSLTPTRADTAETYILRGFYLEHYQSVVNTKSEELPHEHERKCAL